MAHSSSAGHVGYIVWSQKVGSRRNPGMPSQYLMCPEVAISERMHLWEGRSASNQPCELRPSQLRPSQKFVSDNSGVLQI